MSKRLQVALATALAVGTVGLYAQSSSDSSTTSTSQSEMNRGVPDVNVDVGRNANGAVDINRANTERAKGVPGVDVDVGRNASNGAIDVTTSPNADRDANLVGNDGTRVDASTASSGSLEPRADRN